MTSRRFRYIAGRCDHHVCQQGKRGLPGVANLGSKCSAETCCQRLDKRLAYDRVVSLLDTVGYVAPGKRLHGWKDRLGLVEAMHDETQARHQFCALLCHVGTLKQDPKAPVDGEQALIEYRRCRLAYWHDFAKTGLDKTDLVRRH